MYYLKTPAGNKVPRFYNHKATGASMNGNIIGVQADVVMVRLSSDENAGGAGTRWLNYSTVYSSPGGSGWYCMPEPGDTIRLYFPSADESDGYVASSTHLEVGGNRNMIQSENTETSDEPVQMVESLSSSESAEIDQVSGSFSGLQANSAENLTKTAQLSDSMRKLSSENPEVVQSQSIQIFESAGDINSNVSEGGKISRSFASVDSDSVSQPVKAATDAKVMSAFDTPSAKSSVPSAADNSSATGGYTADTSWGANPGSSGGEYSGGGGATGGGSGASSSAVSSAPPDALPEPRTDPDTKTLSNPSGKVVALTPTKITITNGESSITLNNSGIIISSASALKIYAKNKIEITSESKSVEINGKNKIELTQAGSSLELQNKAILKGKKLYMD